MTSQTKIKDRAYYSGMITCQLETMLQTTKARIATSAGSDREIAADQFRVREIKAVLHSRREHCPDCCRDYSDNPLRPGEKCICAEETEEWSGSPCPLDPDNFWIDDKTGERIPA